MIVFYLPRLQNLHIRIEHTHDRNTLCHDGDALGWRKMFYGRVVRRPLPSFGDDYGRCEPSDLLSLSDLYLRPATHKPTTKTNAAICYHDQAYGCHFFFLSCERKMRLKLRRWDAHTHLTKKPCSLILLIGKRGTGKSYLLQHLASIFHDTGKVDMAIGMSPTDESNETLQSSSQNSHLLGL